MRSLALLLALVLLLGPVLDDSAGAEPNGESAPSLAERWIGHPFVAPELSDLAGAPLEDDERHGVVLVLNFWFVACRPCVAEIPRLNELVQRYEGAEVLFLALTFDEVEPLRDFLRDHPFDYRIVPTTQELLEGLGVSTYPSHLVVGRDGVVIDAIDGYESGPRLSAAIDRALEIGE